MLNIKKKKIKISIDIGFIVFNHQTYPNFVNFLKENKIDIEKSNMSFSVSVKETEIEYCGKGLRGIFSNRKIYLILNLLKCFLILLIFTKKNSDLKCINEKETLEDYLKKQNLSEYFVNYHIIPMVSAIWSMPPHESKQMPLKFF